MFDFKDGTSLLLTACILVLLIFVAIAITPIAFAGIAGYIGYRLHKESPARAERVARAETMALYNAAQARNVSFDDDEIEEHLSAAWSPTTPPPLRIQLLEIGRSLYEAEGLSPTIPPPPPLHNTVEAARYRDQLARIETARRDPEITIEALRTISQSLAPIAKAAPSMLGDVLVDVSQFLDPLGKAVQAVIAPYFQERDHDLFKSIKEQLSHNLQGTHRTNIVYPKDYRGDDVVDVYLRDTPLKDLFKLRTPFSIPEEVRFEHTCLTSAPAGQI